MKYLISVLISIFGFSASALTEIAFIEMYHSDGQPIQLEPNGKFAHIAISYQGLWMHAHPRLGVVLQNSKELESLGKIKAVMKIHENKPVDMAFLQESLGKAYDRGFAWDDQKIYCSELVGKALGIPPKPMYFDPKLWPPNYQKLNGLPGLSPDDIYYWLNGSYFLAAHAVPR